MDSETNIKKATTGQRLENLSISKDDCHELKHMKHMFYLVYRFVKLLKKKKKNHKNQKHLSPLEGINELTIFKTVNKGKDQAVIPPLLYQL